jgi:membrane-associated protease RseP (regulator of RpoE activity)
MSDLVFGVVIAIAALNIHELGHLFEARRSGAWIRYVAWALLPGVLFLRGPETATRFQIGLPRTSWESCGLSLRDELWIYRAGPIMSFAAAVLLVVILYVHYAHWIFALAGGCAIGAVFPMLGLGKRSDGARIRVLKRRVSSTGRVK